MDNNALVNEFLVESFENLSSINEDLTQLEKDTGNSDLLNKVYRTVHTMKGSASFLGYKNLQDLTHSSENLLDELREKKFQATPLIVDTLLLSFDLCSTILKSIEKNNDEGNIDILQVKLKLDELVESKGESTSESLEVSSADSGTSRDLEMNELIASHKASASTSEKTEEDEDDSISSAAMDSLKELISEGKIDADAINEFKDVDSDNTEVSEVAISDIILEQEKDSYTKEEDSEEPAVVPITSTVEVMPSVESIPQTTRTIADSFVRVNVKVLDKIMNIVGELVLNRNQILQFSNTKGDNEFSKLSQQLNIITSELQSEVMTTRMQPLSSILTKFERLVRDLSRQSDKQIELRLFGQETELDKTLIEAIKDPLVHIIRNACDHGIETKHERELKSKPNSGILTVKAYNESGQVTIEISDNGRGLDRSKILAKAIDKGLVTEEKSNSLSDSKVFSMIFEPGFSTAEKVTNISGRGVGMDVVKTNIEKIGGSVSIQSELNVGTTFKLRIPLTLAIIPALIIKSAKESFAIPQLDLVELVRLESKEEMALIENIQGSEFFKLRGKLTPVFRLDKELNLVSIHQKTLDLHKVCEDGVVTQDSSSNNSSDIIDSINIVILNSENNYYGIIVDEILDTEEVVVKSLSNSLKRLNLYGGATIMGDGKVALILDSLGFFNAVSDSVLGASTSEEDEATTELDRLGNGELQENLLFTLSDKRVYALALSLVSRLEEFNVDQIEMTGKQPILRYLNSPMPLINLEQTLKLGSKSILESYKELNIHEIKCIVVSISGKNFGIVVNEILDISMDRVEIDDIAVDRAGIMGTIFINEKIVSLIDLYSIIESQGLNFSDKVTHQKAMTNNLGSKKILVVDDSPMYRKLESDTLKEAGYSVDLAMNGEHGLELFKNKKYDLIITDIEMPIVNGYEFALAIREKINDTEIPIIALSTRYSAEDQEKGKKHGFTYHLEKFNRNEVLATIYKILSGE